MKLPTTDHYAVFGDPVAHSKSPRIHRAFAAQTGQMLDYSARQVSAEQFETSVQDFFAHGGKGINCTVPLKELAWRFATRKTARADAAKAVNTLALKADGSILGDNTDGIGLMTDLTVNHGIELSGRRILILGAGGACRGILEPIIGQRPQSVVIANRSPAKATELSLEFADTFNFDTCGFDGLAGLSFDLIINATSASLSGDLPPLPAGLLAENGDCYDLAYADQATAFVRWGQINNARHSLDGLGMLVEQAAEAYLLWRGIRPQTASLIALLNSERNFQAH
ncbi:MAG: shikimate dehydrogenase [Gammaproteobacteria bacterium HGW-Gammaproteobacteria-3]|nr:MAG: shikimate dehydrogenase [Gammaproteobacteria bacterium HGW-Gammaproteobacteria-3]